MLQRSTRPQNLFYIDWWLMNHCSWRCSYCHDIIRNGSASLPYIRDCEEFLDQARLWAERRGLGASVHFNGGEVTEWADFDQLINYAYKQGYKTSFRSHGHVDRARWQTLMQSTSSVILEYHPEHSHSSTFLISVEWAMKNHVHVQINMNMDQNTWDQTNELCDYVEQKWPNVQLYRKMLFDDPVFNTQPKQYSEQQIVFFKQQDGELVQEDQGRETATDYQHSVLDKANSFTGWTCHAGLEQCVVDAWGRVYRGHCRHGGYIGNIGKNDIQWPTQPIVCKLNFCRNHFDNQATKILE